MLKFIVFITLGIGFCLGWINRILWQRYLASRDEQVKVQIEKEVVRMRVDEASTDELLEELSTREFKTEKLDY